MDVKDHTTHSGHESHGVHLCHRCGWPFPNPHPSAKHRRAHKKICGTVEGYTVLNGSEVVSDDEPHSDDGKDKTPSPKIEMKGSLSRSEDEFADAVTEFVDTGSAKKALDRDMFFSFKDAENDGTNDVLDAAPLEISKVDTSVEVSEQTNSLVEKSEETEIKSVLDSSESNLEVSGTGDPVKDSVVEPTPEPSHVSQSQEAGEEKGQESQTSETITEAATEAANVSEITETIPEVSANVGGYDDNVNQENFEKVESVTTDGASEEIKHEIKPDCEHVSEVVKESETVEEIKIEKVEADGKEIKHGIFESDLKHVPEVKEAEVDQTVPVLDEKVEADGKIAPEVKGPETDDSLCVFEEIKHGNIVSDLKHVPQVAKEAEVDQTVLVLNEKVDLGTPNEQIQEVVEEPVAVLTEKKDLEAPELEKSSSELIQEALKEPDTVLTEKEDLEAPELGKPSSEQIQDAAKEPDTVLIKKEDLAGTQLEDQSIEHTDEIVEKTDSVLTEKDLCTPEVEGSSKELIQEAVKEPVAVLTEKEDLGGPQLENQSVEHTDEIVEKMDSVLTEKDLCTPELEGSSKELYQDAVKEPVAVLAEKEEDLGGPHLEKQSNEHTHEVVKKPEDLGAPELKKCTQENIVEEPDSVLTEKEGLGAHKSETCSNGEIIEQKVVSERNLVADVSAETVAPKESSGVAPEPIAEEGNDKLMNNQDSGADLAVNSVISTASLDAETLQSSEKSKVNSEKSNAATSDVYEPPSFMTLVEPETNDNKCASSKAQDSQQKPITEAAQAGWFPTLTDVNTESEVRKKNEEAMAKVTNLTAAKHSTPLKNLLGEARSPSGKQPEPVVQKDEAAVNSSVNDDVLSPPKLIDDPKKGRKKVKGISSWVPFACCSSVNAVK